MTKIHRLRFCIAAGLLSVALLPNAIRAEDSSQSGGDWNGNWNLGTISRKTLSLQQADLIKKGEGNYYDGLGKTIITTTNNIDNRQGNFTTVEGDNTGTLTTHSGSEIGQNTNVIGAVNTSHNTITVDGSNNTVTATNSADSTGCQDGSINVVSIDGTSGAGHTSGSATCN